MMAFLREPGASHPLNPLLHEFSRELAAVGLGVAEGRITPDGDFPVNASGGLIGLGHPVGATGVRMVLDCARQVSGQAGTYQLADPRNMLTFNIGGSTTTCVSFVVGVD